MLAYLKTNNKNRLHLLIYSSVNPFAEGSGQIQRVYNSLLALAKEWDTITLITINKNTSKQNRVDEVLGINPSIKTVYLDYPFRLKILSQFFKILPYLGFGKLSNWELPVIFNQYKTNEEEKVDAVLFEYWHLYKLARSYKSKGIPVFCDTHNILLGSYKEYISEKKNLPAFYKNYLIRRYENLEFNIALAPSFDVIIAINKEEEKVYKSQFPTKRILYAPMGIKYPVKQYLTNSVATNNTPSFIYYGGLSNRRNVQSAIQVYTSLLEINGLDFTYTIIGSNPSEDLYQIATKDPRVKVTGYVDQLESALQGHTLAIIPFEGKYGFRSRIIELMYYGVPVLTTEDGVWGMGFQSGIDILLFNSSDSLSLKIEQAIKDPEKLVRIALNAQNKVEQEFSFEATYQKLAKEIKQYNHETTGILS
jgi:glycosyltransferase involved in cell wall biosynthesis